MTRPYYKPASVERYSRHDDDVSPLVVAGIALASFAAVVGLMAAWVLCLV